MNKVENMKPCAYRVDDKHYSSAFLDWCESQGVDCRELGFLKNQYRDLYEVFIEEDILMYRIKEDDWEEFGDSFSIFGGDRKSFYTKYGVFTSRDAGEWGGSLYCPDGVGVDYLSGNFVDVFVHKDKVYAIDCCRHMWCHTEIYVLEPDKEPKIIFGEGDPAYIEYKGYWIQEDQLFLLVMEEHRLCVYVLKEDEFCLYRKYDYCLYDVRNVVVQNRILYAGLSKSIFKLDLDTGEGEMLTDLNAFAQWELVREDVAFNSTTIE
ncbi:MAG: hypothetical protein Q4C49_11075 [Bacillota bacterium]|nr:hypothetical protein [Bacillota bacterium]